MANIIVERCRQNWPGFWRTYRWLLIIFFVGLLCDAASTIRFMRSEGPEAETNPGIRIVSQVLGPAGIYIGPLIAVVGKTCAALLVSVYWRRGAVYILVVGSILSYWAAWYNVWGTHLYVPRLLLWLP